MDDFTLCSQKKFMKRIVPTFVKNYLKSKIGESVDVNKFQSLSFSQEGEDLILDRYFSGKKNGTYIDVGAHHPQRFSNTYRFYLNGWQGINIDAMPGSMQLFNELRPEDINIEQAIGSQKGKLDYYQFNEPAINTFDPIEADQIIKNGIYQLNQIIKLTVVPLSEILAKHQIFKQVDFMNIDVEGLDLEVLKGCDWDTFHPKIIAVEIRDFNINNPNESYTYTFLISKGYKLFAKTFNTVMFCK